MGNVLTLLRQSVVFDLERNRKQDKYGQPVAKIPSLYYLQDGHRLLFLDRAVPML